MFSYQVLPGAFQAASTTGYAAMAWMSRENEVVMGQVILGQFWNICGIFCNGFE